MSRDAAPRRFEIFEARKYRHIAEYLVNGQLTARWSQDKTSGTWYVSDGWKVAGKRALNAEQAAYVESVI